MCIEMMRKLIAGAMLLSLSVKGLARAEEISVIPRPQHAERRAGDGLTLSGQTRLVADAGDAGALFAAHYLADLAGRTTGLPLTVAEDAPRPGDIQFTSRAEGGAESYHLSISAQGAVISAK